MQRNNGMQLLAALCVMLGVFPVWYWYSTWAMPDAAFLLTGGSLGLTAAAWLHRKYGFGLERKSLLLAGLLARAAAVLLGIGMYFGMHLFLGQAASIAAGVLIWMIYLTSWEILKLPAERLLSVHAFILVCAAYCIGVLLCRLQGKTEFGDTEFLMLGANVAVFGFLRNRRMLLEATAGRILPKGFYLHNFGLLLCFLLPGAVLFAFRKQMAALAGMILKLIWGILVRLFGLLGALVFREEWFAQTDALPQTAPGHPGAAWLGWGISVLITGLMLFLIIRFRSELWDFLRQIVSGIFQFMRRIVLAKAPALPPETHPEYTDSVELIDSFTAHARKRRKASWQHFYRQYRRITDPAEKFRAGYAFWLCALKRWHSEVPPNAVPAKLLELSSGIPDPWLTAHITEIYYRVRYGEHIPTKEELAVMDQLVRTIRKTLLTVRYRVPE